MALSLYGAIKDTLVIVLAGGKGTRLKGLTQEDSKPAVPFGGRYRIIDFPLSNCINSGFKKIGLLTQYNSHTLVHHIQHGWSFFNHRLSEFIQVWPAEQNSENHHWYQGTADAVYQNLRNIERHDPKYVLIISGDHVYKQDFGIVLEEHINSGSKATVSCIIVDRYNASSFGCVDVGEDNKVIRFLEKPENPPHIIGFEDKTYVSQGNYVFDADLLKEVLIKDAENPESTHDFGFNILPELAAEGQLNAHSFDKSCVRYTNQNYYWRDVGTVDAYWEANMDLCTVIPNLNMYDQDWPIFSSSSANHAPAKFIFSEDKRAGYAMDSIVSDNVIISGGKVSNSVIFPHTIVHSYSEINGSIIMRDVKVNRYAKIQQAVVANTCNIPSHLKIGYNSAFDKKYFDVSKSGITLVTPSMLEKLPDNYRELQEIRE